MSRCVSCVTAEITQLTELKKEELLAHIPGVWSLVGREGMVAGAGGILAKDTEMAPPIFRVCLPSSINLV